MRVRDVVYPPVIRAALTVFRVFGFRFDMRGIENIPQTGGAVLASNHVSYFDFMFVGLPGWRRDKRFVRFMAKEAVFRHRISGPLMRGMHHIPVDRAAGAAAYRHALDALRDGEIIGVFPESTIARSFVQRPLKSGAARLAIESGAPLIPVITWGGHRDWTSGRKPRWQRRVPVSIWVDRPLAIAPDDTPATLTDKLGARLRELLDEVLAAYPANDEERRDWWWPAHLGGAAPTPEVAAAAEHSSISRPRST